MDELVNEVEGIETDEFETDDVEATESKGIGIFGKIVGGTAAIATGVAVGYVINHKDQMIENHKAKKAERIAKRQAKQVEKHLKALEKLGWGDEKPTEEK